MKRMFAWVPVLAMLLSGCGDKECCVMSLDAKGIASRAPVVWQDAYVGAVSSVETEAGRTKVLLDLKKPFDAQIRAGVSARIVDDASISPKPFVLLIGGKDASMPVLADGAQIPEAKPLDEMKAQASGFMGWLSGSAHTGEKAGGIALLVLLGVLKFVKKLVKLLIKLLILATIAIVVLVTRSDWKDYQQRAAAAFAGAHEAGNWTMEHASQIKAVLEQIPAATMPK